LGESERFRRYKESGNRIQGKNECRSKTIGKAGTNRGKIF